MEHNPIMEALQKELITTLFNITASRYLAVAGIVVMVYDHLLTIETEVDLVWRNPTKPVSLMFLFNRYLIPVIMALDLYDKSGLTPSISVAFCKYWFFIEGFLQAICFAITHALVALRVRALYSKHPIVERILISGGIMYLTATLILSFFADFAVDQSMTFNPIIQSCFPVKVPRWTYWTWVPALLYETLLFGLTVAKAIEHRRRNITMPVAQVLYRDGFLYFIVIAACSVFNIVVWASLPLSLIGLAKYFTFAFVNVMSSRLVLNLGSLRRQTDWGIRTGSGVLEMHEYPLSPVSPRGFKRDSKRSSRTHLTKEFNRLSIFTPLPPPVGLKRHSRSRSVVRKGSVGGVDMDLEVGPGAKRDNVQSRLGFVPPVYGGRSQVAVQVETEMSVDVDDFESCYRSLQSWDRSTG